MSMPAATLDLGQPAVPLERGGLSFRVQAHASLPMVAGASDIRQAPNGEEFDHRFIASTELVASDGGIILTSAWHLDKFMKRPRFIAMHDIFGWNGNLDEIALGRVVDAQIEDGLPIGQVGASGRALVEYVRYASSPFALEVKSLYDEGGLDDVSVRWDPRTEDIRQPFEEEVQIFGDELMWVAVFVEQLELSSVLFGADSGAQLIRNDLIEAFERCRSRGTPLPHIERMLRGMLPLQVPVATVRTTGTRDDHDLDEAAVADALDELGNAMNSLDAWAQALGPIRQAISDAVTGITNLLASSAAADPDATEVDEEERGGKGGAPEAATGPDVVVRVESKALADLAEGLLTTLTTLGERLDAAMPPAAEIAPEGTPTGDPEPSPAGEGEGGEAEAEGAGEGDASVTDPNASADGDSEPEGTADEPFMDLAAIVESQAAGISS